jgi:hypothetical protein
MPLNFIERHFIQIVNSSYSGLIADTGHTSAHVPQSVQTSGSIL